MTSHTFPSDFLWGVAHAGHQIEGNNSNSDTWFAENVTPTVFREPSGRACNGYELLARGHRPRRRPWAVNAYRFSVEWARVEPAEGTFSAEALDHYEAIVDRCLELGLAPVVTFNHFTCPALVRDARRLARPEGAGAVRALLRPGHGAVRRPDRVRRHPQRAEPAPAALLDRTCPPRSCATSTGPPSRGERGGRGARVPAGQRASARGAGRLEDGLVAGHRAARDAIKARRPDLPVGFSLALVDDVVVGDDPSRSGTASGPRCYERWLELARDDDFLGVQNYERVPYDGQGAVPPPEGAAVNMMGTAIEPLSLAGAVRYAHAVAGVPVLVTEHGMATPDDTLRAAFIEPSLRGLLDLMEDGVPVLGYCHWTLMDNFEWIFGYAHQLGLHEVDRETFARTPKPSAGVYAEITRANAVRSA